MLINTKASDKGMILNRYKKSTVPMGRASVTLGNDYSNQSYGESEYSSTTEI